MLSDLFKENLTIRDNLKNRLVDIKNITKAREITIYLSFIEEELDITIEQLGEICYKFIEEIYDHIKYPKYIRENLATIRKILIETKG